MGKKKIYVITEVTRYEEDTWLIGVPEGYTESWHRFNFDTKYGELTIDQVEADIKELEELQAEIPHDFSGMINERREWIEQELEYERREAESAERAKLDRLEAARKILREAGELP